MDFSDRFFLGIQVSTSIINWLFDLKIMYMKRLVVFTALTDLFKELIILFFAEPINERTDLPGRSQLISRQDRFGYP